MNDTTETHLAHMEHLRLIRQHLQDARRIEVNGLRDCQTFRAIDSVAEHLEALLCALVLNERRKRE